MLHDLPIKYSRGVVTVAAPLAAPAGSTVGGLTVADPNIPLPGDHGLIAWTGDPSIMSGTQLLTAGTLYLSAVRLRRTATVTKLWWIQSTAGTTPTAGQSFAGLYKADGTLLSSASADALITGSNGEKFATLDAAQTNLPAGMYWGGLLINADTPPTVGRTSGVLQSTNNLNLSGASLRFATNGTGRTALPNPLTPASNAVGPSIWMALS